MITVRCRAVALEERKFECHVLHLMQSESLIF